jgi:NAD-dependent deacetylase
MALTDHHRRLIDQVARILRAEHRLLFITGAGLSADSGLPTYRGVAGLYSDDGRTPEGWRVEEVNSGTMMKIRPEVTWNSLRRVVSACEGATFNRGHQVIAEMQSHFRDVWVFTQNVDGFHTSAGSRQVIDIHGDIHHLICSRSRCTWKDTVTEFSHLAELPRCPFCNSVIRPNIVLFDEYLPVEKLSRLDREREIGFDIVFSVGTSSLFPYIIEPIEDAKERGIPTVEINPGETEVSDLIDFKIRAGAAESLDALWTRFHELHGASATARPDGFAPTAS